MNKKINSKRDLPKSFDLKKYDALETMSDKDLFRQLYWRSDDIRSPHSDLPDYGLSFGANYPLYDNLGDPFGELKESEFFQDKQKEYEHKTMPHILDISSKDGIRPLTRYDVSFVNKLTAQDGYWKDKPIVVDDDMVGNLFTEDNGMFWAVMREPINLLDDSLDNIMLSVDLNSRDEVLLEAFADLLPLWRKELGISEPQKPVAGGWDSVKRKIIEYKIIPLIDLISWERATNNRISLGVLAVALFPDGEKDTFIIAQTIRPFLDKLMSGDSLDKLFKELSNNP